MAENAILFFAYGELQNLVQRLSSIPSTQTLSLPQLTLAGAGAGTITSFVLYFIPFLYQILRGVLIVGTNRTPIELVKCKMQVQMLVAPPASSAVAAGVPPTLASPALRNLRGPLAILRDAIRVDGVRGLWLGQTGTLIRETGGGAAWFGTKELICKFLRRDAPRRELRPWESALSGACAGAAYNLAFFPADTIKSTIQTEAELRPASAGTMGQRSFGTVARELYRARGLRGLYAGCGITVARSVPSSALIFLIYDGLTARFA
jgi:mitochondrial ornithine carrier protein